MPIMALFRSPRVDQARYDAIMQELDLEQEPPAGGLTHACGFDDQGVWVIDVWESRADFEAFLTERLKPAFARLGLDFVAPKVIDAYAFKATEQTDRYMRERAARFATTGAAESAPGPAH